VGSSGRVRLRSAAVKHLDFYFDFSSPFAYLGGTQIEAVAARHGAVVRYRPFFLGGLFKAIGTPLVPISVAPEAKRKHFLADLARWADHYDVPFRFPSRFPLNTVKPLRMVLALPEAERARLVRPLFEAYWTLDRDISDEAVLAGVAEAAGLDAPALLAATRDEPLKAALKAATDAAQAAGVCGAPCFVVGDLLFWGQDRLFFVEKALDGWIPRDERRG
jgi:2-hydroxychromene-2-carboxylate isomerase